MAFINKVLLIERIDLPYELWEDLTAESFTNVFIDPVSNNGRLIREALKETEFFSQDFDYYELIID